MYVRTRKLTINQSLIYFLSFCTVLTEYIRSLLQSFWRLREQIVLAKQSAGEISCELVVKFRKSLSFEKSLS